MKLGVVHKESPVELAQDRVGNWVETTKLYTITWLEKTRDTVIGAVLHFGKFSGFSVIEIADSQAEGGLSYLTWLYKQNFLPENLADYICQVATEHGNMGDPEDLYFDH